jgi:integrase
MRALIGVELLRKLPPGPCDIRDTKLKGFVLRVRPSGTHTYFANYNRTRWLKLGTTATLTAPEAREAARDALAEASLGADPIADRKAADGRLTFEQFLTKHYEPWATAQRRTGAEQTARLRATFGDALKGLTLDEITGFHVERWRSARLKDGKSAATVNRDLNTLRGALSRAVEWELLPSHPLAKVKASRTDTLPIVRFLSAPEEKRLRAAMADRDDLRRAERTSANRWRLERGYEPWPELGPYTDHLTPLVLLALNTGLRRGELFHLRWRDVDLAGSRLTVRGASAKSGQTRHVPLNTEAAAILTAWKGATVHDPPQYVFPSPLDDEAPLEDIKSAWLPLVRAAKIEDFRFHDTRHTFASRLVQAGVDLNTVRELLGHADLKMTLRYAHLAPEHKAAAVAKLVSQ